MHFLLVFSLTLVIGVLISDLASRSVLSTAVLFLVVGVISADVTGWIHIDPASPELTKFFEITLFAVLFTDGMRVSQRDIHEGWTLSSRALLIGLPLTLLGTAVLCHWLTGLKWSESLLVGAALSPTDPTFAAAIVGRREVSHRVRRLLNVESGFNDGLALPLVVLLLGLSSGQAMGIGHTVTGLLLGIAIGFVVPWLVITALDSRFFAASGVYERLGAIAIGLIVFSLASLTHANSFLAAFVAGITVAIKGPQVHKAFFAFGEIISELLKLAALLMFGSLLSLQFFRLFTPVAYLFAALVLFLVRPAALMPALAGAKLDRREYITIVWFGPRGFASLLFGFLILEAGTANSSMVFGLIGLVVAASIIAHSSTDTFVARSFRDKKRERHHEAA